MKSRQITTRLEKLVITKVLAALSTPITEMAAYDLGLIDKTGKVVKEPKTSVEKRALTQLTRFTLDLRAILFSSRKMKEHDIITMKRKHGLHDAYSAELDDLSIHEGETQSYRFKELYEAMNDETLTKDAMAEVSKNRSHLVAGKFTLLNPKKRKKFVRGLLGLGDTMSTPVVGDK